MENTTVKFRIGQLIRELSVRNNRDYEKQLVSELSGVNRSTLYGMLNNTHIRVDLSIMARLLSFFEREGMPITPGDLFEYIPDDKPAA